MKYLKNNLSFKLKNKKIAGLHGFKFLISFLIIVSLLFTIMACQPSTTVDPDSSTKETDKNSPGGDKISDESSFFHVKNLDMLEIEDTKVIQSMLVKKGDSRIYAFFTVADKGDNTGGGITYSQGEGKEISEPMVEETMEGAMEETAEATQADVKAEAITFRAGEKGTITTTSDESEETNSSEDSDTSASSLDADISASEFLPPPGSGEVWEGEYQEPNYTFFMVVYDLDGKKINQINLSEILPKEDELGGASQLVADKNNKVYLFSIKNDQAAMDELQKSWAEGTENATLKVEYNLWELDENGKPKDNKIVLAREATDPYVTGVHIDQQDRILLLQYRNITGFDLSGKKIVDITLKNNMDINSSVIEYQGKILVNGSEYPTDEGGKYTNFVRAIDFDKQELSQDIDVPFKDKIGFGSKFVFLDGQAYVTTDSGIDTIDLKTGKTQAFFNWDNTDYYKQSYGSSENIVLSSSTIMASQTITDETTWQTSYQLLLLTKAAKNPNSGKKILEIATLYGIYDTVISKQIFDFNQSDAEYYLTIKRYDQDLGQPQTEEEFIKAYKELRQKMNLDILSGKGPDILYLDASNLDFYANKGILMDLNSFIAKDEIIKPEDYLTNIWDVASIDGKMYYLISKFQLSGWVGAKSVIGDISGWTIEEFDEASQKLPEGMEMLYRQSQKWLFYSLFSANSEKFANMNTGRVNVDNEDFYKILDIAKKYGISDSELENVTEGDVYIDPSELVKNKELALLDANIDSPLGYQNLASIFEEAISVVGYPSVEKNGPVIYFTSTPFAITSNCVAPDVAWDFIRTTILSETLIPEKTDDNSPKFNYGIPVLKSALEAGIEEAKKPIDNNTNSQLRHYSEFFGNGGPLSEENAKDFLTLVTTLKPNKSEFDEQIDTMVQEEIAPYFAGNKSAQEVAKVLQSKLSTMINERQ